MVKGINRSDESVKVAFAGQIVEIGLKLPSDFDVAMLKRGNVLCDPRYPIKVVKKFIA